MSVRGLRVVHELFGQERTQVGFPLNSLPSAPNVRVPVGPAASIPLPTAIRTSTARPKPTNAAIPVARKTNEQVLAGEAVLVASDRERMATVATVGAVNAKIADMVFPTTGFTESFAGRTADGKQTRVFIKAEIPGEVARWRPDGVVISGELTAEELSGDFRDQSDRLVNVCVQGPTPLLRAVREKVGTRIYVLLVRESHIHFVPADSPGSRTDVSANFGALVGWLSGKPREATDVVCKGLQKLVSPGLGHESFLDVVLGYDSNVDLLGSAWYTTGGWWRAEAAGWSYRFEVATRKELMQNGPSDAIHSDVCRVVRAWPLGRVADNNPRLRGEAATTLVVGVGPAAVEHVGFERFVGDPELTIGVRTAGGDKRVRAEAEAAKKRARDEPRFFENLILRPADVYPSPSFELSSAIVMKKAGEADVRVDFTVNYQEKKPMWVRVKNDNDKDTSGNCFDLKFQEGSTKVAYLSSLLRERDPSGCKIWRVNTRSMQSLGRTLVETTTIMMSHLNRGQQAELSLIDASVFTARKAPLVKWGMQEYLSVKRGYSFYEALGYGDVDHHLAKTDKKKMNECLRRNNLLFGTPIGELRNTLQREYPGDLRVQDAVRNVEEAMTDEQKKKWGGLSLRGLLEQMEEVAKKYDPRENAAGMQRAWVLQNLKDTWLSLMTTAGAADALEIVTFLNSLNVDIGMSYRSNMFRKTLYPDPSGGHTHIRINSDGTAYEEVSVGEGDFRLVGMESNPKEVAWAVKENFFPGALLWLPEWILQR